MRVNPNSLKPNLSIYQVLKRPILTEKALALLNQNNKKKSMYLK